MKQLLGSTLRRGAAVLATAALFVQSFVPALTPSALAPAAAVAIVAAVSVAAPQAFATESQNKFPSSQGGLKHENLNFMGLKVKRVTQTATSALLVNGAGLLYGICAFEGTLGQYSAAYDTAGQQVAGNIFTAANNAYKISPNVYTNTDTTSSNANKGCWIPPAPIKFVTGLYGGQTNALHSSQFLVGCSDGSNPCEL